MAEMWNIVRGPLVTEKAVRLREATHQYLFKVELGANKLAIKQAVEALFGVTVLSVNTAVNRGKLKRRGRFAGRRPRWKKAIVTLKEGEKIEIIEGV